jgi:hypothetical protein
LGIDGAAAHVLVVGDVANILGYTTQELDGACGLARVARTVLRSEVLRMLVGEPLDLMVTSSGATFLARDEFIAAYAARRAPLAMLVVTRRGDDAALARLRGAGVRAEYVQIPIDAQAFAARVDTALRAVQAATPTSAQENRTPDPSGPGVTPGVITRREYGDSEMASISKTLEEAMKIDGAIATAIADWDSGLCLGTAGGGARLNIEVAAAGNCQVVKAKMATMTELGIKGSIHDILIALEDQVHLIRPLRRGENLFIYLAIDKAKGNLGMARHRLQKLEAELSL